MRAWSARHCVSAGCVVVLLLSAGPAFAAEPGEEWAERVQILYDAKTRSVERVWLKVRDGEPHLNLEFLWEPDPESGFDPAATGGIVEGRGTLVWRVRGSAPHDRRAIHSTYEGEMKDGRPHGQGRLERRDGEVFEGQWVAGRLHGDGMHLDIQGNRYSGAFRDGLPHGHGRQAMADGTIYVGGFSRGLRDGEGTVRLPGGTRYASRWRAGIETDAGRPDAIADATLGGLLLAQAGGGAAGKVDLSVTVEPRATQEATLRYTHAVLDERVEIYPENPGIVDTWLGQAVARPYGYAMDFGYIDWSNAPAFLEVRFETQDGSRVPLDALELQVEDSQIYRKPFLSVVNHAGCVGYRPSFSFQNNGWGAVENARLTLEFFNRDAPAQASGSFTLEAGGFDFGGDVPLEAVLGEAGIDTAALADARFSCPSLDEVQQCRQRVIGEGAFGDLGQLLSGELDLTVGVRGRIAYRWTDSRGNAVDGDEPFEAALQLGFIETEMMTAEGGDGWGTAPEALRYQEVRLPDDAQNYVVDMPVRGNKNLSAYVGRLKMFADHTSVHRFRVAARFADGSERYSKPVALFYAKPREHFHTPPEPASGCYLDPGYFGGGGG